jgi:hypothetical protein
MPPHQPYYHYHQSFTIFIFSHQLSGACLTFSFKMDMSKFQNFGKNITSTLSPFAARTGQFMREQFGQADDKVSSSYTR